MSKTKVINHNNISWYQLLKPSEKQLQVLQKKYRFHPLDIEDCLEGVQRPKLDIYRSYIFLVLHLPQWDNQSKTLERIELNVFLGPSFVIIIHDKEIPLLDKFFYQAKNNPKQKKRYFKKSSYYLFYLVFNQLLLNINPILKQINTILREIDNNILQGKYKNVLNQLSVMRRNLILFQTIIKPQIPIFSRLEKGKAKIANSEYAIYWGNLVDRLKSIWEQLEDSSQTIEGLSKTNESLLTYKTNEIIKVLTIFSVVLMPLTLISGIYGMNISLPFSNSPLSFTFITTIMIAITILMLLFFKIKKWL
jgi:magnesium transporter